MILWQNNFKTHAEKIILPQNHSAQPLYGQEKKTVKSWNVRI